MKAEEAARILDDVSDIIYSRVTDVTEEQQLIDQALNALDRIGGRGGSSRAKVETGIVELVRKFHIADELNPWPVTKFLLGYARRTIRAEALLRRCIRAHEDGGYEPMFRAIEAAKCILEEAENNSGNESEVSGPVSNGEKQQTPETPAPRGRTE